MTVYGNASMSRKLGTLKKNTVVRVTAYSGNVARSTYNGYTGYARVSSMDAVAEVAEEATVNASTRVYTSASTSSKSVSVKKGLKVYVLATSGSWAMVERNGYVGYMSNSRLTYESETPDATATPSLEDAIPGTVTVSSLPVYRSASTSSKKLGTVKRGQEVNVIR